MRETLGEYQVKEILGEGGMGSVYRGFQPSLEREVAIKVLADKIARNETFVARFQREARAAASLVNPNVIQIFSIGEEEGIHYFAMEYVRGMDVAQHLMEGRTFSLEESMDIIIQVVEALCAAAEVGLVHRDLKPSNIMLTERGRVKITDFGLAKTTDSNLTDVGTIVGTANYMSPEQAMGDALDFRSDIYSLGVVFYELVAGRPPFMADSPAAVLYKHAYEPPQKPTEINPELPSEVDDVILKMLAKKSDERYASAEDLLSEMRTLQRRLYGGTGAGGESGSSATQRRTAPTQVTGRERPPSSHHDEPTVIQEKPLNASEVRPHVRHKALIADDVAAVRSLLSTILKEKDFDIIEVSDGKEAVATTVSERPDLVLLDIGLPGLDGLGVLAEFEKQNVKSKVIVISGQKERETVERTRVYPISGYLTKPVNIHELRSRIDSIMEGEPDLVDNSASLPETDKRYVLVFDSNRYSQLLFRQVLGADNYRVACSGDEKQVLNILQEDLPDALLVCMSSDPAAGRRVLEVVQARKLQLPVVIVADDGQKESLADLAGISPVPVLYRPVRVELLRRQVEEAISIGGGGNRGGMTSGSFTMILKKQIVEENYFTVFDFARTIAPAVPERSRKSFEDGIVNKPARGVCNMIANVLKHMKETHDAELALKFVRNAYKQGNFETRNLCLILLRELLEPEAEAEILNRVVADEDYRIRIRVLQRMGELKLTEFANLAVRFLNDDVWKVRHAAAACLESLGLAAILEPVVVFHARAGKPLPDRLRKLIVEAKEPEIIDHLEGLSRNQAPEIRAFVTEVMGMMHTSQPTTTVIERLSDKHPAVRAAAARALARSRNPKVVGALVRALPDDNGEVQKAVIDSLLQHKISPPASALVRVLGGRGKRINEAAMKLVDKLANRPDEFERILFSLEKLDVETRKVLSVLLDHISLDEDTLRRTVRDLASKDRNVRSQAVSAIHRAIQPRSKA